jgi:hypothetical protein
MKIRVLQLIPQELEDDLGEIEGMSGVEDN